MTPGGGGACWGRNPGGSVRVVWALSQTHNPTTPDQVRPQTRIASHRSAISPIQVLRRDERSICAARGSKTNPRRALFFLPFPRLAPHAGRSVPSVSRRFKKPFKKHSNTNQDCNAAAYGRSAPAGAFRPASRPSRRGSAARAAGRGRRPFPPVSELFTGRPDEFPDSERILLLGPE